MNKDTLGDRMKSYENSYRVSLPIRMPVVIRIDGKAFHTYTKSCKKPVDEGLVDCMNITAKYLCQNVQGCQLAYVQSDEISLLLNNYETLETQPWFDNNLQKMASVSASMAGAIFTLESPKIWSDNDDSTFPIYKPAFFDSRVFLLPKEEVTNYFIWRQQDATRNSVQMLARTLYSHKQCENKNNSELQEMIFQKGLNWNDCPTPQKRGRCIIKQALTLLSKNPLTDETVTTVRHEWIVDNEIPVFTQDRQYIGKHV